MITSPYRSPDAPTVVLDTDVGYDLDDALTFWIAAVLRIANLVVITTDETEHDQRAQLAGAILDSFARPEVPVIAGRRLPGADTRFLMDPLPRAAQPVRTDVVDYVSALCEKSTHPIIWVGIGPTSNLADVLSARPELAKRIKLTMMGGWLDHYRRPDLASHNPRLDPAAFRLVMAAAHQPRLVLSTHCNVDELAITPTSNLYSWLTMPEAPADYALITENASRWFDHRARRAPDAVPSSWLNDPLTFAAAIDDDDLLVKFRTEKVRIEADARMYRDPHGHPIQVSTHVDYTGFLTWLSTILPLTPIER
ncbi:nucleoside hydrolase [Nocardia suismassiliense]|uniref:nucleoside hydrolase n=1 Tax=Nocardia suismassiliense TaxID=2077092 RepID=UPI00131F337D|nr:nucleoside hydrolase [Nocardia suismassiliense]